MKPDALRDLTPPFYVVDLPLLRRRFDEIHRAFGSVFSEIIVGYSYKTNYLPCVLSTLHAKGAWAEVVSDLEYELALRMRVPAEKIIFNGPIKSTRALSKALQGGSLIHIDSLDEARQIAQLVSEQQLEDVQVGFRINVRHPEGEGHRRRSRFGLPTADIPPAVEALASAGVTATSLHAHIATKGRSLEHFEGLVRELGEAAKAVGVEDLDYIDVGGGFGFSPPGADGRDYPSFSEYARIIHDRLLQVDKDLTSKTLVIEPGMAMVNDAVRYVTRVESIKEIAGRKIAFIDGSIHTVKPTRHTLNLPVQVWNSRGELKTGEESTYDLVGYTCMDDDYIAVDQALPTLELGDRIEIDNVGAYTLVFKPPFIRSMPATYALDEGRVELDCREQTFKDFFACLSIEDSR